MKKQVLIFIAMLTMMTTMTNAQTKPNRAEDEKAIRQVVKNIFDAWAAGDSVKYADNFTDDVDYRVWNGHRISGREENIKGHQEIFDTFYKGTNIETEIKKISFLTDDVAAVHAQCTMYKDGKRVADVPPTVPLMIFKKVNGKWKVAVFQNTPIIKRGELVVGRTNENDGKLNSIQFPTDY